MPIFREVDVFQKIGKMALGYPKLPRCGGFIKPVPGLMFQFSFGLCEELSLPLSTPGNQIQKGKCICDTAQLFLFGHLVPFPSRKRFLVLHWVGLQDWETEPGFGEGKNTGHVQIPDPIITLH